MRLSAPASLLAAACILLNPNLFFLSLLVPALAAESSHHATGELADADSLYLNGQLAEAEKLYRHQLESHAGAAALKRAHWGLARVLAAQGHLTEAEAEATRALAGEPGGASNPELTAAIKSFRQDIRARMNAEAGAGSPGSAAGELTGVISAPGAGGVIRSMGFHVSTGVFNNNTFSDASEAEFVLRRAIEYGEKTAGPDSDLVLDRTVQLGELYEKQMRYGELVPVLKRLVAIFGKMPPEKQQASAMKLMELAQSLSQYSRPLEASMLTGPLAKLDMSTWPNALDLAARLEQLATSCQGQRRYADAEPLLKGSLSIKEKWLPANDPQLSKARVALAKVFEQEHKLSAAQELYEMALASEEKAHGEGNGQSLDALIGIEQFYTGSGKWEQARSLMPKLVKCIGAASGQNQRNELQQVMTVILAFTDHGDSDSADTLLQELMKTRYATDRNYQYQVGQDLQKLAVSYANAGQIDKAEKTYLTLIDYKHGLADNTYPMVSDIWEALTRLTLERGKYERGMEYAHKLADYAGSGQMNAEKALTSLRQLAAVCQSSGHADGAEELYKTVAAISGKSGRYDSGQAIRDICALAQVYIAAGKKVQAADTLKQAEQLLLKSLPTDLPDLSKEFEDYFTRLTGAARYAEAAGFLEEVGNGISFGRMGNGYSGAELFMRIAQAHEATDREKAGELYKRALTVGEKAYGPNGRELIGILSTYANYLRLAGKSAEAQEMDERSRAIVNNGTTVPRHLHFFRTPLTPVR